MLLMYGLGVVNLEGILKGSGDVVEGRLNGGGNVLEGRLSGWGVFP